MKVKSILLISILCVLLIFPSIIVTSIPIPRGLYYKLTPEEDKLYVNPDFGSDYSNPLTDITPIPQHPFMASNGWNNMHCDAYMSDACFKSGPLANNSVVNSTFRGIAECVTICFTSDGQMVTCCVSPLTPRLIMMDPDTLEETARYTLPRRPIFSFLDPIGLFEDTSGGAYFYLDNEDRIVVATHEQAIEIIQVLPQDFELAKKYELSDYVIDLEFPERDKIGCALPDWDGNIWFVSRYGVVGVINVTDDSIKTIELTNNSVREEIQNSFAVAEDGVYIVSDHALYRFNLNDEITMDWRVEYDRGTRRKPGMLSQGSGTTPTITDKFVVIGDNADPKMRMNIYHRNNGLLACSIPLFEDNKSCTENSPIAISHDNGTTSIIVVNSYGHKNLLNLTLGRVTEPGITRIDVIPDSQVGYTCKEVWTSDEYPCSALPKLTTGNGLIYLYTKTPATLWPNPWYLATLDFRTGKTVYKLLVGSSFTFNNNWGPINIGPDGTVYIGMLLGLISIRDT